MTRLRSQAGMTLVEISVVVAVIGILAAVAIPSFKSMMPKVRLGNATQTLSNEIAMLRMSAIAKSSWYQVAFDTGAESYSLAMPNPAAPPPEKVFATTTLPAVDIESVRYLSDLSTPPTNIVRFNANGTTSVPLFYKGVFVTLATPVGTAPTLKKRVVVETTGRIYSQKWTGGPEAVTTSWVED